MSINFPEGTQDFPCKILQVVHVAKTDYSTFSASSGTFHDVMSASITPQSSSNKVLVQWNSNYSTNNDNQRGGFRMLRGSTAIGVGDAESSRIQTATVNMIVERNSEAKQASQVLVDSPSTTSSTTYKLQVIAEGGAGIISINRSESSDNNNTHYRGSSNIVLMEVEV